MINNKNLKLTVLLFSALFVFSCSNDENSENNTIDDDEVLIDNDEKIDDEKTDDEEVIEEEEEKEETVIDDDEEEENNTPFGSLNPELTPSENFDLSTWNISIPIDEGDGTATNISVAEINAGYENTTYFYTGDDGGMVFKCFVDGYKTSKNTSYTRSEFREMLRGTDTDIDTKGVNKNNWVFGSAPAEDLKDAASFDGEMSATLAVNHVSTTGKSSQVGRVVVGQIHANDDEPIRLYYRKLPDNDLGSIYFAHEPRDGYGDEEWYEMIGSRDKNASNPSDGIALDEKFSYTINVVGNQLTVTIYREGKTDVVKSISMANSGYDEGGQYMYFKAGVYIQDNTGDDDDYTQATFYALEKSHTTN